MLRKNTVTGSGCIAYKYKAVVIGSGPGGYVCALRLAQLGAKVAVVEKDKIGGVCTNTGCIPVKTLHASVKILRDAKNSAKHGIKTGEITLDYGAMRKRAIDVSRLSAKGIEFLLKKNGVDLFLGKAKIRDRNTVEVCGSGGGTTLECENIVLATGSAPIELPGLPYNGGNGSVKIISSETLLDMESLPESLVIVGGGYIGVEFAGIFRSLGCDITLVEMMDRILPGIDPEVVSIIHRSLTRDGIKILTGTKIDGLTSGGVIVGGNEIRAKHILVSVGRRPQFDKNELDAIGVKYARGITVDDRMRTTVNNVWAVGDAVGRYMLAHIASHEGIVTAENIMGHDRRMDYSAVPSCVFTFPELGIVGNCDPSLKSGKFPFAASGKARALGDTEGFIKVYLDSRANGGMNGGANRGMNSGADGVQNGNHIVNQTGEHIVGCAIVGPHASDLIGEACLAVRNRIKLSDIYDTIHPHPVLSEAFAESCLNACGKSLHC